MASETEENGHSDRVEQALKPLREDCALVDGRPFDHFLCPILLVDEKVDLCMGHIVNEVIPNSSRACVVQRKDVDNFYGSLVEADFTTKLQSLSMSPCDILLDPDMSKKMRPKMIVDGEEWEHYQDRNGKTSQDSGIPVEHSRIVGHVGGSKPLQWVLKKTPDQIRAVEDRSFELMIGKDYRLAALVSLIKAAHLTLFKLLGYSYALSAAGMQIGYWTLGKFYREHGHKLPSEAVKEASNYFRPYVNMMRIIEGFTGEPPLGTIADCPAIPGK